MRFIFLMLVLFALAALAVCGTPVKFYRNIGEIGSGLYGLGLGTLCIISAAVIDEVLP